MLDESAAVAGKLTGVWKFKCPKCLQVHRQASSIQRCAVKIAHVLLGNDVRLKLENPMQLNPFYAAKKGLLEEYEALDNGPSGGEFKMPVEVLVRAETMSEVTLLMLEEFQKFIAKAAVDYKQAMQDSLVLKAKADSAPTVKLGNTEIVHKGWEPGTDIGTCEFAKVDIIRYYLDLVPRPNKLADDLLSDLVRYRVELEALVADEDLIVFQGDTKWYGIKVVNGIAKLVSLHAKGGHKTKLKELRDACSI